MPMIQTIKNLTDYVFRFNREQQFVLDRIETNPKKRPDFQTWAVITILLPLLTFVIAVAFNIITAPSVGFIYDNWQKFLLNGSIPIISFGIISSGVSYLMENLEIISTPEIQNIRRRVMGIALIFLFLTSVLYIFQSVAFVTDSMKFLQNIFMLFFSLLVCLFSISIGFKMYLLQSSMASDYLDNITDGTENNINALEKTFADVSE